MWSYQVETARNSIRALWRNRLPKMTSTSLTLPRNHGKSVRRRRIFRVADRWSLVMFQTILLPIPHLFRVYFTAHFSFVTFSLNYHDFYINFPINPSVTSSFCSLQGCDIAAFGTFSLYFNRIYLIFILFWKYIARTCRSKLLSFRDSPLFGDAHRFLDSFAELFTLPYDYIFHV